MKIDIHSWNAWNAIVYLDGFRISCITADDKAGMVEVYDTAHPDWNIATIDPTKKLYGKVRIVIVENQRLREVYKNERQYRGLFKPGLIASGSKRRYTEWRASKPMDERTKHFAKGGIIKNPEHLFPIDRNGYGPMQDRACGHLGLTKPKGKELDVECHIDLHPPLTLLSSSTDIMTSAIMSISRLPDTTPGEGNENCRDD